MPYQPPHRLTDKTVQYIDRGHGKLRIRKNTFNKHYQQTFKEQIKKEKINQKNLNAPRIRNRTQKQRGILQAIPDQQMKAAMAEDSQTVKQNGKN